MKPEKEFLDPPVDPPVFMLSLLGLPCLMGIGRGGDFGGEEEKGLVGEDGPSERRLRV